PQGRPDGGTALPERLAEERLRLLDRGEGPEAVEHADLEPAAVEERALAPAPCAVLGGARTAERAHVVAAVVMDDEHPPIGREDAVSLGEVRRVDAAERRPQ